ncbi:hypothetical protein FRC09_010281 [Ceratobasidium sp. 395]|nr:hypothetical protein FRC09_010281 [Ceratobasidium sp. 395]
MVSLAKSWDAGGIVYSVAVSPDGARVVTGCGGCVQLWDLHSGQMMLGPLRGHSSSAWSVSYSPDGRTIASGSKDKTIRVWDTATGAAVMKSLEGHTDAIQSVTFSYDGRLIISGSHDGTVRLWDTRTGRSARRPIDVGAWVFSVAVSPDGSKVVVGCDRGIMKTYDAAAGTVLFRHVGHTEWVSSIAFSPNGRRIASGSNDGTVRIWDAVIGSSRRGLQKRHTDTVSSVSYSPDGAYIASGSYDKTIRIWDAATRVQTDSLHSHTDMVFAVAFTPDGGALVSGSEDNTIKLWDVPRARSRDHENVRNLDPAPPLFDEITSTTTPEQIVLHLGTRGCANLTNQLDLSTCSTYPISSGGFGDIYRCKLKSNVDVAIKTVRLYVDSSEQSQKHMKHAARELYTWSKCRHPNVQELLGLVMFRDQIGMVAPWESNGDMPRYLEQNPNTDRRRMSIQIVEGLSYLHESGVIHGDLKGANVLISKNGSPRLADFGNAASQEFSLRFTQGSTAGSLSPRWAAPELFKGEKCNVPADIYALGMEALTGNVPFLGRPEHAIMYSVMFERSQPKQPEETMPTGSDDGDKLWSLLQWCWQYEPEKRPSAAEVKKTMKEITQAGLNYEETVQESFNNEETLQESSWIARIFSDSGIWND